MIVFLGGPVRGAFWRIPVFLVVLVVLVCFLAFRCVFCGFGGFGLFWCGLVHYGALWCVSVVLVRFGAFWCILAGFASFWCVLMRSGAVVRFGRTPLGPTLGACGLGGHRDRGAWRGSRRSSPSPHEISALACRILTADPGHLETGLMSGFLGRF